jgi:vancomycin resistance protein VanJ
MTPSLTGRNPLKKNRLRRAAGQISIAAAWVWAVVVLVWNLLRFFPGDRWLPVRLGSYFAPWLFLPLLPALLVALLGHRRWLLIALVPLLMLFVGRFGFLFLPRRPPEQVQGVELKVMTFNVHRRNDNASGIVDLIRAQKPDIIALQELPDRISSMLQAELAQEYPHQLVEERYSMPLALFSRYPLRAQQISENTGRVQQAIVETPNGAVMVWNLHAAIAWLQPRWKEQRQTIQGVADSVAAADGPVIVLGDLNTTDQTENYRILTRRLKDLHREIGWGFGFTFPDGKWGLHGFWPIVRIDYVLFSEHFEPLQIKRGTPVYKSDHRPLFGRLLLQGGVTP